ncbi:Rv1476 family membrane protein [Corynebacterium minutissimum]|uniref:1-deoxy-D-xylulose-5-phosphate synthase n=1 Tax=Corynebacterium minutissimum TaxID=38301 RepID=A0A2X4UBL3_9CORY|nr:DUF6676 family protein [Corynebacterium minutissimum]KHO29462.1 membrane protein [Corynebacterium minutissimum]QPS58878.1 hypothetical protein I6G51_08020 [Corynebacterium minutissimum]QQA80332.1 hypothetical protein I6H49_04840 [Corynebacterium minutissimum]SQH99985.1 1-deoxy-D-xylulose-5-phosphate synthase [Corynebacterium minutissimum]VEG05948.1 1-deoxy-D-xylulose-5-phosphate synthase [Corynebacterium minutissimum]
MIPAGVDVDDIAEQLSDDGVAFSNPELALDDALQEPIAASLHPDHGVAVVDVFPEKIPDLRDLATTLQEKTGLDTVILQAPMKVSVVSDSYDRAAIEAGEDSLPTGLDQVTLVNDFYATADDFSVPWVCIVGIFFCLAALAAFTAFRHAARQAPATKPATDVVEAPVG